MRAVLQRVSKASVRSSGYRAEIGPGLVILIGIGKDDSQEDIDYIVDKSVNLRIFSDAENKMNLSVKDIKGEILAVPQFTLYGNCRKGRRPNFTQSADKDKGKEYFNRYIKKLKRTEIKVKKGLFGAEMKVNIVNNGPVTIILDSGKK
ncbi:MAG: D-aminoacyl-tRNA deacylase [Elusimicrobiota bacterium]